MTPTLIIDEFNGLSGSWALIEIELTNAGYQRGAPPTGEHFDRPIAEEHRCEQCGGPCRYEGWQTTRSYRAFAVCTRCDFSVEF